MTKLFKVENIEFQNGDKTVARPLPIKKLKVIQEIFSEWGDDLRKTIDLQESTQKAIEEARKSGKGDVDEIMAAAKEKASKFRDYNDVLLSGSLLALKHWGVTNAREQDVEIDMDYCENELDIFTAERICAVAGSLELGEVKDGEGEVVGKQPAASTA